MFSIQLSEFFHFKNCYIHFQEFSFKNYFKFIHFLTNCEFSVFNIQLKSYILFARNKTLIKQFTDEYAWIDLAKQLYKRVYTSIGRFESR